MKKRTVFAAVATLAMLAMHPSMALANGSNHPITGTCYENGDWFRSSNIRYVSSGGSKIGVNFSTTPSKGIAFYVNNHNTGVKIGVTVYGPPENTWLWMTGSAVNGGTAFQNNFKLQVSGHQDNYSFDGSEHY
jgi:hypothetical protein